MMHGTMNIKKGGGRIFTARYELIIKIWFAFILGSKWLKTLFQNSSNMNFNTKTLFTISVNILGGGGEQGRHLLAWLYHVITHAVVAKRQLILRKSL